MTRNGFRPTPEQVDAAIDPRVLHEMRQLTTLLSKWPEWNRSCHSNKCACLESLLLHARVLKDFFEKSARQGNHDDVLAVDYGFLAKPVELGGSVSERLNKDLAHLTYASVLRPLEGKQWTSDMLAPLIERCNEFILFILKTRGPNWTDSQVQPWRELLCAIRPLASNDNRQCRQQQTQPPQSRDPGTY